MSFRLGGTVIETPGGAQAIDWSRQAHGPCDERAA
jgi:hypothetical protein